MKNNVFVMSIAALFMFGSGTSDDKLKLES